MDTLNIKRSSILIVEDNHLDILVLKVLLEKYFNLYIVTNIEDAVKAVSELDFDIVLTDIHLGEINNDGIRLLKKIKENNNTTHLKVFAITAFAENKENLMHYGFNDVLTKPVIKEEILAILSEVTSERKY